MTFSTFVLAAVFLVVLFIFPALGAPTNTGSFVHTDTHAVTCQDYQISWGGGTPPYTLILQDIAAPDSPLESDIVNATSLVWPPDVPAGTIVQLKLTDSSGTLAQSKTFSIENGTDTSCVKSRNTSLATNTFGEASSNSSAGFPSISGGLASTTASAVSPTSVFPTGVASTAVAPEYSSSSVASTSSSIGDSNTGPLSQGSKVLVAAILAPIAVFMLSVLLLLFLRLRRRNRRRESDPESMAVQSLQPVVISFSRSTTETSGSPTAYPPEKALPVPPDRPQVTADELQNAIDRIQEMYAIMRQAQRSSAGTGDSGRVLELQRQIEYLMADNAALGGQPPPEYESH